MRILYLNNSKRTKCVNCKQNLDFKYLKKWIFKKKINLDICSYCNISQKSIKNIR